MGRIALPLLPKSVLSKTLLCACFCIILLVAFHSTQESFPKQQQRQRNCSPYQVQRKPSKEVTIFGSALNNYLHECDAIKRQLIALRVDCELNTNFDGSRLLVFCSYTAYVEWQELHQATPTQSIAVFRHYKSDAKMAKEPFNIGTFGKVGHVQYVNEKSSFNFIARVNNDDPIVDNCKLGEPCSVSMAKQWTSKTIRRFFTDDYRNDDFTLGTSFFYFFP